MRPVVPGLLNERQRAMLRILLDAAPNSISVADIRADARMGKTTAAYASATARTLAGRGLIEIVGTYCGRMVYRVPDDRAPAVASAIEAGMVPFDESPAAARSPVMRAPRRISAPAADRFQVPRTVGDPFDPIERACFILGADCQRFECKRPALLVAEANRRLERLGGPLIPYPGVFVPDHIRRSA